jgi:tetratricopeptide (TPR) repeat protein
MKSPLEQIKEELKEKPFISFLNSLCLLLTLILTFINNLTSIVKVAFHSDINFSALFLIIFFVVRFYLNNLQKRRSHKYLRIFKNLTWLILLIPIYFTIKFLVGLKNKELGCDIKSKKTGVFITRFAPISVDDAFASTLYGKLNSRFQDNQAVNVRRLNKVILETDENYLDTIKATFSKNCCKSGLFIFGDRKDNNSFNCRVYSYKFLNFNAQSVQASDKLIIYIQNPDQLNFTIESEAQIISDFTFGLLYYGKGDYTISNKSLIAALSQNKNQKNFQFISYCHMYIGENYGKAGETSKAIEEYKNGIVADSTNEYLHYNLGTMYTKAGKFSDAYKEFDIAEKLDSRLKNPLIDFKLAPKKGNQNAIVIDTKPIDSSRNNINYSKNASLAPLWSERCYVISNKEKFGVINSEGDTLAKCVYDEINEYSNKGVECFVLIVDKRYGAVIHKHFNDGYILHELPLEYSDHSIYSAIDFCINNHLGSKEEFHKRHNLVAPLPGK